MPCIGILGIRISEDELPLDLRQKIFSNKYKNFLNDDVIDHKNWSHLQLSDNCHGICKRNPRVDSRLKIYQISLKDITLDIYVNSYRSYLYPYFYIVYEFTNSRYEDNYISIPGDKDDDFNNFLNQLQMLKISCKNTGFFILEE